MNPTIVLTVFLFAAGIYILVSAILKDKAFFGTRELMPEFLIRTIGVRAARVFFIIVGIACLVWGIVRVVNPPREIPVAFLSEIARPAGIDLVADGALAELNSAEGIEALQSDGGRWTSFRTKLPKDSPHFADARDAASAGPDFWKGFHLGKRTIGGSTIEGRIVHFDSDYVVCDNMLFSKHPLDSAAFAMVICDEESSGADGLKLIFARAGTELYDVLNQ